MLLSTLEHTIRFYKIDDENEWELLLIVIQWVVFSSLQILMIKLRSENAINILVKAIPFLYLIIVFHLVE